MPLSAEEAPLRFATRQREARRIGEMVEEGLRKVEVARELGIGRATLYRRLGEAKGERYGHQSRRLDQEP